MTLGLVALALSLLGIVIVSIVGNTCYLQGGCTISLDDLLRRLGIQTQTMPEVKAQPNVDDPYVPNTLPNSYEAENLTDLTLDQVLDQFPQPTSTVQPTAIATVNPLPITPNPTATPDDCTYDRIKQRIGSRTVAQVVGDVGNIRSGEPEYHLGAPPNGVIPSTGEIGVIGKAMEICKTGTAKFSDYYICADGVDCKGYRILSEGNATFVARRVVGQDIATIEQFIRPSPEVNPPYYWGVLKDQDDADYYLRPAHNWENIPWK